MAYPLTTVALGSSTQTAEYRFALLLRFRMELRLPVQGYAEPAEPESLWANQISSIGIPVGATSLAPVPP